MNRVVRLGDLLVRQGVLAIVLLLPCVLPAVLLGQQQKAQDQSVPDAPTPQEPDSLGNTHLRHDAGQRSSGHPCGPGHEYHPGTARHRQPASRSGPGTANATRSSRPGTNAKGPGNLPHHGQLRHCAGHSAGQETSTSGRADLARFSNLREQPAPAYRLFQRRRGARSPLPW